MPLSAFLSYSTTKLLLQALLLISTVIIIYIPGLTGPFMLDDFGSLPTLYDTITLRGFWYAVLDGAAGPTGRPVSLFSLALQHSQWQDPYYFKLVNVLIHAINATLVFWLSHLVINRLPVKTKKHIHLICIAIALIWALHPIQISTVLYVIQRMVLLSSLFMLIGCITYIYGRSYIEKNKRRKGYILITLSISFFGLLALLSKEVGFQVILYILCIELTLFKAVNSRTQRLFFYWKHIFLTLPIILFVGYIFMRIEGSITTYETLRNHSMDERILTQTKILWEYIVQIIFPRISELGLYHDNYPPMKSWLSPIAIISVTATTSLFISSIMLRKKYPIFAFVSLWFLLGHSMEASIIPLELYFEHRNYLPSFGIILGAVLLLYWLLAHVQSKILQYTYRTVALLIFILLIGLTYQQTKLWGNSYAYAVVQAKEHSNSIRARSLMIGELSRTFQLDKAYDETKKLKQQFQRSSIYLLEIQFSCVDSRFPLPNIEDLQKQIAKSKLEMASLKKISELLEYAINGECDVLSPDYLLTIVNAFELNPAFAKRTNDFATFRATIYMNLKKDINLAIQSLLPYDQLKYENRMLLARYLATATQYQMALTVLDNTVKTLSNSLKDRIKQEEIIELQSVINQDIINQQQMIEQ